MPTYEPSITQQLTPEAIQGFGKMITDIVKPHAAFQSAMTLAVSKDPKLAQSLTDLEHNAPGSLQSLGFGSVGAVLSHLPESPENQALRENRPEAIHAAKTKVAAEDATQGVTIARMNNLFLALKNNPTLASEDVRRILTGQNSAEAALTSTELATKTAQLPAVKAGAQADVAKSLYETKLYKDMAQKNPALAGIDYVGMARQFVKSGQMTPQLSALLSTPALPGMMSPQELFKMAVAQANREQSDGLRLHIADLTNTNVKDREAASRAFEMYRSTGIGNLPTWKKYLADPSSAANLIGKDPSTLSPDDRDLQAVAEAQVKSNTTAQNSQLNAANVRLQSAVNGFNANKNGGASDTDLQSSLGLINSALVQKAGAPGQEVFVAHWGKPPTGGSKQLYYTNTKGNVVDASIALAGSPMQKGPAQSNDGPDAQTITYAAYIQKFQGADRAAALARLKSKDPVAYAKVVKMLGDKK